MKISSEEKLVIIMLIVLIVLGVFIYINPNSFFYYHDMIQKFSYKLGGVLVVYNIETMREIIKIVEVKYNLGKIEIIECDMFACEPKEKNIIYC